MPVTREEPVLRFIRKLAVREEFARRPDDELLERFVNSRDEAAFGALVRRHGPMVLRVCLQVLDNEHDAEDAFQATFLVLSRKASSIKKRESVGSWLFGVAHHAASELKRKCRRRRSHERHAAQPSATDPLSVLTVREAQAILNEELARLPAKYRAPLVLCSLEGLTREEAAHQLGLPVGTLKSRLEQARKLLRKRFDSRGLTVPGAFAAFVFSEQMASAAIPARLLTSTLQAATAVAVGNAAASVVSTNVATLTEGVLKAMFMTKLKIATALVLAVVVLAAGSAVLTSGNLTAQQAERPKTDSPPPNALQLHAASQRKDKNADDNLKNTLWALEERRAQAWAQGDWETQQKFLADDFIGVSARAARDSKAAIIEGAKRFRYVDWKTRDVEIRRISNDVAILSYIYSCREVSPSGEHLRTARDRRTSLVWAQRNGGWVIVFCQETLLPGGE